MALLIGWLSQPSLKSTSYIAATIADDNEFYLHYDSDNYDSDSSSDSDVGSRCFDHFLNCHYFSSMLSWMFSPFQSATNSVVTTRNPLDNNAVKWWHFAKWCRCCCCYSQHNSWFTKCLDNNRVSSYVSSDDSDIESRLGFRNEHAMMAAAVGPSAPQQLQFPQPNNINTSYNSGHLRRKHLRLKRKYQDEERHTWFFWLAACSEVFVVLLICLLALLNAVSVMISTFYYYILYKLSLLLTLFFVISIGYNCIQVKLKLSHLQSCSMLKNIKITIILRYLIILLPCTKF